MHRFQGNTDMLAALAGERQGGRLLRMDFPRGDGPPDALMLVNKLDAIEAMSRDFRVKLEVLSDDARIPLKAVTGKMVTVSLLREDGGMRYFNGFVHKFRFMKTDGGFAFYRMILRPWLADLRLRKDCAMLRDLSMSELCESIFAPYLKRDYMLRLSEDDPAVTMLIQHNETDHNHLHRRLEARGWHYWYEHRFDGHTLWLGDDTRLAEPIDGPSPEMPFRSEAGSIEDDSIHQWSATRRVGSSQSTVGSYDFKSARAAAGERWSLNRQGDVPHFDVFEDMGAYGFNPAGADGDALARRRMEEHDARGQYFKAVGNDRFAQPGRWHLLGEHFSGLPKPYRPTRDESPPEDIGARQYLILSVRHRASNNYHLGGAAPSSYRNRFKCMRKSIPWRPGRGFNSSDTRIHGAQTAVVVGPPGEEIYTDQYGRVRVRFHWDRAGRQNQGISAWVRVMTPWAGQGYGQIGLPRIGDEVVVQFIDGNCDRPLIVGSLYNAANMPPWELPQNKTQSGILTRSTVGGGMANANALRFEDKKGCEELWLHAERDQRIEVEHDESHTVGNDRGKTVGRDETSHIKHDRNETVDHDERITIHNNRSETVDRDERIEIGANRSEHVGKNEQVRIDGHRSERVMLTKEETIGLAKSLFVGGAYQTTVAGLMNTSVGLTQLEEVGLSKKVVVGDSSELSAVTEHKVVVGSSVLTITPTRIELLADEILIQGRKKVEVHGDDIELNPGDGVAAASTNDTLFDQDELEQYFEVTDENNALVDLIYRIDADGKKLFEEPLNSRGTTKSCPINTKASFVCWKAAS